MASTRVLGMAVVAGTLAWGCTGSTTGTNTEDAGKGGSTSSSSSSSSTSSSSASSTSSSTSSSSGGSTSSSSTSSGSTSSSGGGSSAMSSTGGTSSGDTCTGNPPYFCVSGVPGGQCGDALEQPTCDAQGGWLCPQGTIPTSDCACLGLPAPGCTCTSTGWSCPDGGTGGACAGDPVTCVSGVPGGQCGDALLVSDCVNGNWTCPQDTIPVDECACIGLPIPGCTCTADGWSCPTDGGAPVCRGLAPACVAGTPGGACSDALELSECTDAGWACPRDTIPVSECACIGRPPGVCTCTADGWQCGDAGFSSRDASR